MLWLGVYYLFNFEVAVCCLLMSLGYMPQFILKPIRSFVTGVHIPKAQEIGTAVIVGLIALLVESVRKGSKHAHHHTDDFKEKLMTDIKRFRAERNSYIAFGCLFLFLLIWQIWVLLKKLINSEDEKERQDKVHGALLKQMKNKDAQSGLVEVAKGLDKVAKGDGESKGVEQLQLEVERLSQMVETLKMEKEELRSELRMIDGKEGGGGAGGDGLRKRGGAGSAKDD